MAHRSTPRRSDGQVLREIGERSCTRRKDVTGRDVRLGSRVLPLLVSLSMPSEM